MLFGLFRGYHQPFGRQLRNMHSTMQQYQRGYSRLMCRRNMAAKYPSSYRWCLLLSLRWCCERRLQLRSEVCSTYLRHHRWAHDVELPSCHRCDLSAADNSQSGIMYDQRSIRTAGHLSPIHGWNLCHWSWHGH
jgi:hypothetical protein